MSISVMPKRPASSGATWIVDVVAGDDQRKLGAFGFNALEVLEDRVGGSLVPVLADPLHGRQHFDVLAELGGKDVPAVAQVPDQVQRFVLCEHQNTAEVGIDTIGQGEVNDAVRPAERHRRFRGILGQRVQALSGAPSQQNGQNIFHWC
jgi:hypothetical protein